MPTLLVQPAEEAKVEAAAENTDEPMKNKAVDDSKRKTRVQRNKEKRNKEIRRVDDVKKREKEKLRSIDNIKAYIREIEKDKVEYQEQKKEKEERKRSKLELQKEGVVFGSKRIGRYKYDQVAVDFQLPENLPKKLNGIKVDEGTSIRSCYESILRRGLVQPGADGRGQRKVKTKLKFRFTSSSHDA